MSILFKIEEIICIILNKLYEFIYKYRNVIFWLCIIFSALLLFLWSYVVPYSEIDDYQFMYILLNDESIKISSLQDILTSQINYYLGWSGRIVFHSVLQLLLWIGKYAVSIVCSLSIIATGFIGAKIVSKNNRYRKIIVLLIISLFYFFNPVWNETVLWATGMTVYCLPTPFILLYIYCNISAVKNAKLEKVLDNSLVFMLLGFIVGCSNENVAVALVALMFLYLILLYKENKLCLKHILGYLGLLVGCAVLMLAPGNYARITATGVSNYSLIYNLLVRFGAFAQVTADTGFIVIITLITTYVLSNKVKLHSSISYHMIVIGIMEMLAMLGSPLGFPSRSFLPSMMMFMLSSLINIENIDCFGCKRKELNMLAMIIFICFIVTAGYHATFTYINPMPAC